MSKFERARGLIVISVDVHGLAPWTARMALDTGATRTMVTPSLLAKIGVPQSGLPPMNVIGTTGIGRVRRAILPRVTALGLIRHHMLAVVAALPEALTIEGLLGLDFFRDQRLVIDLRQETVRVD